jgi:hypothetical protein
MPAMLPANIYAAGSQGPGMADTPLLPRTLMQVLFLAAAAVVALGSV